MGLPAIPPYVLPVASELPLSPLRWRADRHRAALLVHDMQGYFVRAFTPDASPILPAFANIRTLIDQADRVGVPVFYTAQPGRQPRERRGLQADVWGPGMSDQPEEQHIVTALAPRPHHVVLTKWRYSAFQRSDFAEQLAANGRDQLIVTGVFAHIGCLLTAADAFMRDIEPFFVADAVADFSRERHDQALEYVAGRCAVPVLTSMLVEQL